MLGVPPSESDPNNAKVLRSVKGRDKGGRLEGGGAREGFKFIGGLKMIVVYYNMAERENLRRFKIVYS